MSTTKSSHLPADITVKDRAIAILPIQVVFHQKKTQTQHKKLCKTGNSEKSHGKIKHLWLHHSQKQSKSCMACKKDSVPTKGSSNLSTAGWNVDINNATVWAFRSGGNKIRSQSPRTNLHILNIKVHICTDSTHPSQRNTLPMSFVKMLLERPCLTSLFQANASSSV